MVDPIMDAARTGHVTGDRVVWTTAVERAMHNRTGRPLAEVEVG